MAFLRKWRLNEEVHLGVWIQRARKRDGGEKKMSRKVMLKVHYGAEPVLSGTWVYEPKGKQSSRWNADQGYFPRERQGGTLALAMDCHGWDWYLLPVVHIWKPKGLQYEQDQQDGKVQVQQVNLLFFKTDEGCLKLIASPMAGIEIRSREFEDTYKEHWLWEKYEGTIKAARSPKCC